MNMKIKREETGRGGAIPSFFLFPAPPTFRVPFSFLSSLLSETLEQANGICVKISIMNRYSQERMSSFSLGIVYFRELFNEQDNY